jgi:hypothetical protein
MSDGKIWPRPDGTYSCANIMLVAVYMHVACQRIKAGLRKSKRTPRSASLAGQLKRLKVPAEMNPARAPLPSHH